MRLKILPFVIIVLLLVSDSARATSVLPRSLDQRCAEADAVCVGTVQSSFCFRGAEGGIYTQTEIRVDEALKGTFPATVYVVHRGGILAGVGELNGNRPILWHGEERLFFLKLRADGTAFVNDGPAGAILLDSGALRNLFLVQIRALYPDAQSHGSDLTNTGAAAPRRQSLSVVGLLPTDGTPYRYTHGDRGEAIGYLVDMDDRPSGISTNVALTAVSNAFQAWADASSLTFRYLGLQSFGMAAINVGQLDGVIRVQLHDLHNHINSSSTLGQGGSGFTFSTGDASVGGDGGAVNGERFHFSTRGYITMEHSQATLSDPVALEEVLTHEIGHVLGMAHTSTSGSIMESTIHDPSVGARLIDYDRTTIQLAYPTNNTPPFGFERNMTTVAYTFGSHPTAGGINQVQAFGLDMQTTNLTVTLVNTVTNNGFFSLIGDILTFDIGPGNFGDVDGGADSFARATLILSDGTNDSPFFDVLVKAIRQDSRPSGAVDGMPDSWMTQFFGTINPADNALFAATADHDGDGINNLDEFRIGTDPTDASSKLTFIEAGQEEAINFSTVPGNLYSLEVSTNLTTWIHAALPMIATGTNQLVTNFVNVGDELGFFRLQRVP